MEIGVIEEESVEVGVVEGKGAGDVFDGVEEEHLVVEVHGVVEGRGGERVVEGIEEDQVEVEMQAVVDW